ncbi:MAG TPA: signal peptidase I [bacterium]|nr:signal peptidase I [bacterium]
MSKTESKRREEPRKGAPPPKKKKRKKPSKGGFWESTKTVVYALVVALVIRTFFFQAFRIPSGSMEDTLLVGDFLLVDKLTYGAHVPFTDLRLPGFRQPRKGDIIVFKEWNANRDYIKRCVGVGGDTLEVHDNGVVIDGVPLNEPYRAEKPSPALARVVRNYGPVTIPEDTIFMMGDNRNNSADSRERHHGPLDLDRVVGRAFVIYWSCEPPQWLMRMQDSWIAGLLQLFVGKPRFTRIGNWLAKDYTETYGLPGPGERTFGSAVAAPLTGSGAAADSATAGAVGAAD